MLTYALLSLLVGMLLGQRFKVLALVPAVAIILLATGVAAIAGPDHWSPGPIAVAAVATLQIGYVLGCSIHRLIAAARTSRLRTFSFDASSQERHGAFIRR